MQKLTAADPETRSADPVADNLERLKALFPEAFTEGKIDFDVLRQLLGGAVDEREEKYGLTWHGKRRARQLALTPSTGTLRPCREESVDWDTTQNLMIEGDNLEVLKLLQKSYAGKIKLIYMDPPYNTGNDFIYPDNFSDSIAGYLSLTGQRGSDGTRVLSNTESSGRFHSDWLSMMYPRLKLARALLHQDGLVFISIDDKEVAHLRELCDEIFGEENFVEQVAWKNKYGSGAMTRGFASVHEYVLCYSRFPLVSLEAPLSDEAIATYRLKDSKYETRGGYITQPLATTSKDPRPNLRYPIMWQGREVWPEKQWIWSQERVLAAQSNDELVFNEKNGKVSVRVKQYLREEDGSLRMGKPLSMMVGPFNQAGTKEIKSLLGDGVFPFPKPTDLIGYFASFRVNGASNDDAVVLDLFAGSGTTGHAVMALNAKDGGRRRYILVQLPEVVHQKTYSTIADISKERLRRAAASLQNSGERGADLGFRVFKLDSSNIRTWEPDRDDLEMTLESSIEHIKEGRTEQDILFELLLKLGLDLTVPIEQREIAGKTVHNIGAGTLLVCLAERIGRDDVEPLSHGIVAWHREIAPAGDTHVVFRDSAFADDVVKTNVAAILEQHGLKHVRSL